MRTASYELSLLIPKGKQYRAMFVSSCLNLPELIGLRPDLSLTYKILYFHENQLEYPIQSEKERDFQFGFNQYLSCIISNRILFNSK